LIVEVTSCGFVGVVWTTLMTCPENKLSFCISITHTLRFYIKTNLVICKSSTHSLKISEERHV
jgi:hypothetical protein